MTLNDKTIKNLFTELIKDESFIKCTTELGKVHVECKGSNVILLTLLSHIMDSLINDTTITIDDLLYVVKLVDTKK